MRPHLPTINNMSPTYNLQPTIDLYPWPDGLGFSGSEEWWAYVRRQNEADKLDLLVTLAHLNETICQLLLEHDAALLDRFQFSCSMLECLSSLDAESLPAFVSDLHKTLK